MTAAGLLIEKLGYFVFLYAPKYVMLVGLLVGTQVRETA